MDDEDVEEAADLESLPLASCYDALKQLLEGPAKKGWMRSRRRGLRPWRQPAIHWVRREHVEVFLEHGYDVDASRAGMVPGAGRGGAKQAGGASQSSVEPIALNQIRGRRTRQNG